MALTLVEAAKGEQNPLRRGIIQIFAKSSPVLQRIPLQNIAGNAYTYSKEAALPGVAFRGVNEAYVPSTGVINPETESLRIAGGEIDVDVFDVKTRPANSVGELRAIQTSMKVRAMGAYFTKMFFKGDSTVNPRQFDGLQRRITGSQLIDMGATAGGDTLTLAKLDEMLDALDGADVLYMNRTLRRKVNALIRAAGQTQEMVTDAFGRQILSYAGVPIATVDTDETGAEVLGFTEANPGGGSAVGTSIYAVKFGADEYTALLQNGAIDARDLGELETKPAFRTRVEWYVSPAVFNGRGVARLWGIKNA